MKIKIASMIISLLYLPVYYYFLYKILEHINASEILWFLFWFLLPFAFVITILSKLAEWEE